MIGEWVVFLTALTFACILVDYCLFPVFRINMINAFLKLTRVKHPQIDGSRIFTIGNTYKRKLILKAEQLFVEGTDDIPAGCYFTYTNEMLITKDALDTDDGIDTYGTPETMRKVVGVISHEFMHMLLILNNMKRASTMFDNLSSYSESLDLNGMEDRHV